MAERDLQIISWNLCDGINDLAIQASVLDLAPDVAVFPEGHKEEVGLEAATVSRFRNAGYDIYDKNYEDDDGRKDRHSLVVLAKPELIRVAESVRLAGRNAIRLTMHNDAQFMGVHFDDRHEERRLAQATTAIRSLGGTALVAGDFNAMHRSDGNARRLRVVAPFAHMLPSRNPGEKQNKLQRLGSLSQRLTEMASGTTLQLFTEAGFEDADPTHAVTMQKGPIAGQLDHILYRGNVAVERRIVVEDGDNLSDHKRIRATLRVTQ